MRLDGPLSAFEVARLLKMEVHLDRHLGPRGFTTRSRQIWVKGGERGTRMEHACAHEIGHHHVYDQDAEPQLLERACDRFAAALLLPRAEFGASARDLDCDVRTLERVWPYSSAEAICRRLGEVVPGVTSAAWRIMDPKWRAPAEPGAELAELERAALGDAYGRASGRAVVESLAGRVRAWRTGAPPMRALSVCRAA